MCKILYFGYYSLNNPRNSILIRGLRENGAEVFECRDYSRLAIVRWVKLFFKYLKFLGRFDVMIVGFSGQEIMPLARLLTFPPWSGFSRKPLVFNAFTSHYMGYVLDRKYFSPDGFRAKYYRFIDRWSCKLADVVILDTQAHIDYFVHEFGLDKKKFKKVWLGADSQIFRPQPSKKSDISVFNAVFWGNFIPLQGVEYIIKAAKILENDGVKFCLIGGGGQTFEDNKKLTRKSGLKNVEFTGRLSQEDLNKKIANADVCLGAFSDNIKANITIQNKIFEALASNRAVLSARTKAIQELLTDGKNALLCNPADPKDLAGKILELKKNPELKNRIAEQGHEIFMQKLTSQKLGKNLLGAIHEVV